MADKKNTILNWLKDNWFKLAIVILFIILICELSGIQTELHKIYRYM
jgi:hypothetical protein